MDYTLWLWFHPYLIIKVTRITIKITIKTPTTTTAASLLTTFAVLLLLQLLPLLGVMNSWTWRLKLIIITTIMAALRPRLWLILTTIVFYLPILSAKRWFLFFFFFLKALQIKVWISGTYLDYLLCHLAWFHVILTRSELKWSNLSSHTVQTHLEEFLTKLSELARETYSLGSSSD